MCQFQPTEQFSFCIQSSCPGTDRHFIETTASKQATEASTAIVRRLFRAYKVSSKLELFILT